MNGRTNSHGSTIDDLQVPLDPCTNLRAEAGNGSVTLYWDDPVDKYATPEGETAQNPQQLVSVWDHTIVVRKVGSQPANPNDGIVVTSSGVRDQYLSTGYTDDSLTNDTTYYYGVFAVNKDGVASVGAFVDATPKPGRPLSELTEGTLINILENGSPVEFYLAKHNYEPDLNGQGRELVVRKDVYPGMVAAGPANMRFNSTPGYSWYNGTYKNMFSANVQTMMGSTSYTTTSLRELGFSDNTFSSGVKQWLFEGSPLPIAGILRNAQLNGEGADQWTRTLNTYSGGQIYYVSTTGMWLASYDDADACYRPCFTLPSTALVDSDLSLIETTGQATALSAA